MSKPELITCPHCRIDDIPYGANICRGCHAEIEYGTPTAFIMVLFFGWPILGFICARMLAESFTIFNNTTIGWVIVGIITGIGWFFSFVICTRLFKNRINFKRLIKK